MASQIYKEPVYGNFKKPRSERVKDRKNKSALKRAKRPDNDLKHLKNIKRLPCIVSGVRHNMDPHHLKCMGERGTGMKATDKWLVPLTRAEHSKVESIASKNEEQWFLDRGINCKLFAAELWLARGSFPQIEEVWQKHWDKKPRVLKQGNQ